MASRKVKKMFYGCGLILLIRLTLVYFQLGPYYYSILDTENSLSANANNAESVNIPKKGPPVKTIQWYDAWHNGVGVRCRSRVVDFKRCKKYKTCKILDHYIVKDAQNDRSTPEGPLEADAVVFQGAHIESLIPPVRRNSDQVFVFAERETWMHLGMLNSMLSPVEQYKTTKYAESSILDLTVPDVLVYPQKYKNTNKFLPVFNWTMTYRFDSDIPMLYGEILRKKKKPVVNHDELRRIYTAKQAEVVWIVSHCMTKSKREHYVEELRKYIPIDVYGACGNKQCPRKQGADLCFREITKKYKFILSFENTFHTDYATEKLFDWYARDIVQVVYGMARYSKIVPSYTVIDAADYQSPQELAKYLKSVGSSKTEYLRYIQKKRNYEVYGHDPMQQRAYCQLCDWLHHVDSHRKSYPSIDKWWQVNDTSTYSKLYNQAVKYDRDYNMYHVVAGLFIIGYLLCGCSCLFVRQIILCSKGYSRTIRRRVHSSSYK